MYAYLSTIVRVKRVEVYGIICRRESDSWDARIVSSMIRIDVGVALIITWQRVIPVSCNPWLSEIKNYFGCTLSVDSYPEINGLVDQPVLPNKISIERRGSG